MHLAQFNDVAAREFVYPAHRFSGRGVVICGGGEKYYPCVWVCINMLRKVGCRLPIELWHFTGELSEIQMALIQQLKVHCVDATEIRKSNPVRTLGGWQLKPYSIIHSSFQEVLFLDADNVPIVDPTFLFETAQYAATGAIFWPDRGRLDRSRSAWLVTGVAYRNEAEFESGQIVVDKKRCWKALQLTMHLNEWSDFFYRHFHGDKETFHLAWRKIDQPYSMPSRAIEELGGYSMAQHDFEGRRIFQHRCLPKWILKNNPHLPRFQFEAECIEYLDHLSAQMTKCNGGNGTSYK